MGKVGKQELGVSYVKRKRDKYDGIVRALKRCVHVDQDYANLLLKEAYDEDSPKPKEDSDALEEAISRSEVEILNNVGAEVGRGSSFNLFVPSVEHCQNLDGTVMDSGYRKEALNLLTRPYDEEEYKKLWKDIKMQLSSSSTNGRGKSLRSLHKALEEAISESEVEILENVGAEVGKGSSFNPFVSSGEHCQNVDDPHYMTFLANAKRHGTSYAFKANSDQNGLPLFLKYEKDRDLEAHGVEKGQENVRGKCKLGRSSNALKTNATKNMIVDKQKMKDGNFLSKKRGNEDRDLDNRKHRIDVKIVAYKEQKMKSVLEEATSQSEVEILENVGAEVGRGSSCNPFVPSVEHCYNMDATIMDTGYRKEVLNLLMRPYDDEEYKKLWKDIKMPLSSSSTNRRGKSLLLLHKAVNQKIKRTNHDKDKKLNIMRGFFFWLKHLTRQDAFQPWEDAECLQTMPGSS